MVSEKALRRAASRSAGMPGGAVTGKPIALSLETKRKIAFSSGFLARSSKSGTSGRSFSFVSPVCSRTLIFFSAIQCGQPAFSPDQTTAARPSTSPRSIASWMVFPP